LKTVGKILISKNKYKHKNGVIRFYVLCFWTLPANCFTTDVAVVKDGEE